ncbi:MAG: type II secretion system F family protein [Vallitaleaceae bacterium]|nr:type II secretion system F family protein [Vallitaleaceae bacterium]
MKKNKVHLETSDLIIFARQLALIIDSQVSLHDGLKMIQNKSDNKQLADILDDVVEEIQKGLTLGDALKKHEAILSTFFVNMIDIGEKSGNLVNVLEQIGDTFEKENETHQKVKAAVSYPIILSILMLGVVILLVVQILPMFSDVLESLGGTMPIITQVILGISLFIGKYFFVILIVVLILVYFMLSYKKTESGQLFFDTLKFKMPIQKQIVISTTATRFARNLGILIQSGINITEAIYMLLPVMNNKYIEGKLEQAVKDIESGETLDEVMEKLQLYPWVLIKLFTVAQTTGHLDDVLKKAASIMEAETDLRLKRLTTVIEPILIMILSIIIGIVLISVVLPVVNIMNSIG